MGVVSSSVSNCDIFNTNRKNFESLAYRVIRGNRLIGDPLKKPLRPLKGILISLAAVCVISGCGNSQEEFVFTGTNRPIVNPTPDPTPDPVDFAPQVSLDANALIYVRDADAATLAPNATFFDDNANLNGGTLTISASGTGLNLNAPATPAIGTITNNNSSAVSVALNSDATPTAIQAFLRAVTVSSSGGTAAFGDRTVTVTATDANGLSDSATRTVSIVVGVTANFEDFTAGSVDGQQGWTSAGMMDQAVAAVARMEAAFDVFGTQALRISNGVAENNFPNSVRSAPLSVPVGESTATPLATERNNTFDASFDFGTTSPNEQVGLQMSISPIDNDDGRMTLVRLLDTADGIDVVVLEYDDATDTFPTVTIVEGLSRAVPHNLRIALTTVDGASNDILQVFVDGTLEYTGSGWEQYYRDIMSNLVLIERLQFQVRPGDQNAANTGNGFYFDNFTITSTDTP